MKIKKLKIDEDRFNHIKWVLLITLWTFCLSVFMSFFSDIILRNTNLVISFLLLLFIIITGIIFDIIGIAVAAADERPFHSMASGKVSGSAQSIKLIKNASKVSNICNDVIGDICGIISGASATFIVVKTVQLYPGINLGLFTVFISSLVAALTVGGKAIGKDIAINYSKSIIAICGRILFSFERIFKITFFK
jgi:CBS domain containing-hemolysin-like protein